MEKEIIETLKQHGLSVTESRKRILSLFLKSKGALEHSTIEKSAKTLDRVTIYRTLQSFMEKGLIHTIPSDNNSVKYALCKNCENGEHNHNHVHFICERCGVTTCMEDLAVPNITLPYKFIFKETEVVIKGICDNCNKRPLIR